MAQYSIRHTCGHTVTHNLTGPGDQRSRTEEWLRTTCCLSCRREEDARRAQATAEEVGLPLLQGSPKQTEWALRIRQRLLTEVEAYRAEWETLLLTRGRGTATESQVEAHRQALKAALQTLEQTTTAAWWIDRRDATARTILREMLAK